MIAVLNNIPAAKRAGPTTDLSALERKIDRRDRRL